jgi:hypothetical protein
MCRLAICPSTPGGAGRLAARSASLLKVAELSRTSGVAQTTLHRYLALIEGAFVTSTLPAWKGDPGHRMARAPKVYLTDTGLAAWLTGADAQRHGVDRERLGALLEAFVTMEIRKQLGWSAVDARLSHYRSHDGTKMDVVLEVQAGRIVGIEVKAGATVRADDLEDCAGWQIASAAAGRAACSSTSAGKRSPSASGSRRSRSRRSGRHRHVRRCSLGADTRVKLLGQPLEVNVVPPSVVPPSHPAAEYSVTDPRIAGLSHLVAEIDSASQGVTQSGASGRRGVTLSHQVARAGVRLSVADGRAHQVRRSGPPQGWRVAVPSPVSGPPAWS